MFFGILKSYIIDLYGFYFEEYMPGYLTGMSCRTQRILGRRRGAK